MGLIYTIVCPQVSKFFRLVFEACFWSPYCRSSWDADNQLSFYLFRGRPVLMLVFHFARFLPLCGLSGGSFWIHVHSRSIFTRMSTSPHHLALSRMLFEFLYSFFGLWVCLSVRVSTLYVITRALYIPTLVVVDMHGFSRYLVDFTVLVILTDLLI